MTTATETFRYNPKQPRWPKGHPLGGQWKSSKRGTPSGKVRRAPQWALDEIQHGPNVVDPETGLVYDEWGWHDPSYDHEWCSNCDPPGLAWIRFGPGHTVDYKPAGYWDDQAPDVMPVPDDSFERLLQDAADGFMLPIGENEENQWGYLASLQFVDHEPGYSVTAAFTLTDFDGNKVGDARRIFSDDGEGHLIVTHDYLSIGEQDQNKGLGTAFNRYMEREVYEPLGVSKIKVHADIDVGGFAWATAGYDWQGEHPQGINFLLNRVERAVKEMRDESASNRRFVANWEEPRADYDKMLPGDWPEPDYGAPAAPKFDAMDATIATWRDTIFSGDPEDFPTPFDLAMLGYEPGATIWPGKVGMLGSDWYGVKYL